MKRGALFNMGGLVGALNLVNQGISEAAKRQGWQLFGIRNGLNGLLESNGVIDLSSADLPVDYFAREGTTLGSTKNSVLPKRTDEIIAALRELKLDFVAFTGGDGTFKNVRPVIEALDIQHVAFPKTSDGDTPGAALGLASAVTENIRTIRNHLNVSAGSGYIQVAQIMDNAAARPVILTAMYLGARIALMGDWQWDRDAVCTIAKEPLLRERGPYDLPPESLLVMGEGVEMFDGTIPMHRRPNGKDRHADTSEEFATNLSQATGLEVRGMNTRHGPRGITYETDRRIAKEMLCLAEETIIEGKSGIITLQDPYIRFCESRSEIVIPGGNLELMSLGEATKGDGKMGADDPLIHEASSKGIYIGKKRPPNAERPPLRILEARPLPPAPRR